MNERGANTAWTQQIRRIIEANARQEGEEAAAARSKKAEDKEGEKSQPQSSRTQRATER
jgi:hypothetical protein